MALLLACALPQAGNDGVPPLTTRRFPEDYRGIEQSAAANAWWARTKDVPLDRAGRWRFTFGLELRAQSETFRGDGLRATEASNVGYVWWRALPVLDLRRGTTRAFAQFIFAYVTGLEEEPGPIDENRADIQQLFLSDRWETGSTDLSFRVGRQLLAYGSQRLIGYRYGPNVPLPFDAAIGTIERGWFRADVLWGRPVLTRPGEFDDKPDSSQELYGVYTTTDLGEQGIDAYYLGYDDELGVYDQGAAPEERHTFGLRWFGQRESVDWNGEVFAQIGDFGGQDIRAWSATIEAGHLFERAPMRPRLFGRASIISGDDDPLDDELNSFNPLFPRGKYFGEIGTIGPINLIDGLVGVQLEVAPGWAIDASTTAYWRESLRDGVYANNRQLLRSGAGSDARFVGYQGDIALNRNVSRTVSWSVGYSVFVGGEFIRDTGPSDPVHFFILSARLLF
ncbi:MAG: alginate export family protein [Planctomycetota bacterium]